MAGRGCQPVPSGSGSVPGSLCPATIPEKWVCGHQGASRTAGWGKDIGVTQPRIEEASTTGIRRKGSHGPVGCGWWVIDLQIPEDLHYVWRPKPIHSTPSKQGSEEARPVDPARAGLKNRRRPLGGRQCDSPRPPSRSTTKTRRRLSMACSRRGNRCSSTGVIPGVPKSLIAPERLCPPVPAQMGVVPGHSPRGAGRGGARHSGGGR